VPTYTGGGTPLCADGVPTMGEGSPLCADGAPPWENEGHSAHTVHPPWERGELFAQKSLPLPGRKGGLFAHHSSLFLPKTGIVRYTTVTHPGIHHRREPYREVYPPTNTIGRHTGRYTHHIHTGRHAGSVYHPIYTQGGMLGVLTTLYTPREACWECYTPLYTQGGMLGVLFPVIPTQGS